jgi:hypothetical protein
MKDFFISYNKDDAFHAVTIRNWLIEDNYTCVMQESDFIAGSNFILEIQDATKNCERTIAILSPSYLSSQFTQPEWAAAFLKDPTGKNKSLIPVRIQECKLEGLLASIVYIDLVGLSAEKRRIKFKKAIKSILSNKNSKLLSTSIKKSEFKEKSNPIIKQIISGDKNIQVAGDFIYTEKPINKNILPSPESIGGDPLLKQRIKGLFNKIGESREKRFGKKAYAILANKIKSDFGIKNNKWTIIWDWPKECAPPIMNYLQNKYDNTIDGRIEKASRRSDYLHTRPQLYKKEKELLGHLGLDLQSQEVRNSLSTYFGVDSHSKLTHLEHWQWVCYLEGRVKALENS